MLALEERFMIRELYRKGVSISEIARRIGRDRKTIRQIVTAPDLVAAKHARQAKACKIDPYAPYLAWCHVSCHGAQRRNKKDGREEQKVHHFNAPRAFSQEILLF